jgi:hypothetical protein
MGEAARQRAMEFEWDTILARMNRYYDDVLGTGTPSTDAAPSSAL